MGREREEPWMATGDASACNGRCTTPEACRHAAALHPLHWDRRGLSRRLLRHRLPRLEDVVDGAGVIERWYVRRREGRGVQARGRDDKALVESEAEGLDGRGRRLAASVPRSLIFADADAFAAVCRP